MTEPKGPTALSPASRPRRIGMLVESLSDRFWQELVLSVDVAARRRDVHLFVFVGGTLDAPELAARQANRCYLLAGPDNIDALLVASLGSSAGPERLAQYFERYHPLPMCALTALFDHLPSVCTDNVRSMRDAVSHLIDVHGVRRVGFIRGPRINSEAELRYEGYRQALGAHGIEVDPAFVLEGDFSEVSGARVIRELVVDGRVPFDALVSANDSMALGALAELARRGIRVPEQLLMVSFDDVPEGRWGKPSLTTVRQPLNILADIALDHVLRQLDGDAADPFILVPGEVVVRESCGCRAALEAGHERRPSRVPPGAGQESTLERARTALLGLNPSGSADLDPSWRRELAESVAHDSAPRGELSHRLGWLLARGAAGGRELGDWQRVVSALRGALPEPVRGQREPDLLRARVTIGDVAERQQAALRIQSEGVLKHTIGSGSAILGSFSEPQIFSALSQRFPYLKVAASAAPARTP